MPPATERRQVMSVSRSAFLRRMPRTPDCSSRSASGSVHGPQFDQPLQQCLRSERLVHDKQVRPPVPDQVQRLGQTGHRAEKIQIRATAQGAANPFGRNRLRVTHSHVFPGAIGGGLLIGRRRRRRDPQRFAARLPRPRLRRAEIRGQRSG
jgi:hypothetical protein